MKAVVAAYNQEKALVGAFSVIVQLGRLIVYNSTSNVITRRRNDADQLPSLHLDIPQLLLFLAEMVLCIHRCAVPLIK